MTDQSRVEAVEQAIGDYIWTHRTIDPLKLAKAAIEANDAWMKEQERRNTTVCPRCGARCDVDDFECRGCGQEVRWQPGYEPTFPEEPDK